MVLPPEPIHPTGESDLAQFKPSTLAIEVETFAGKVHAERDSTAAVTPIGQLPFLSNSLNLETAVERGKDVQDIDVHSEDEISVVTC